MTHSSRSTSQYGNRTMVNPLRVVIMYRRKRDRERDTHTYPYIHKFTYSFPDLSTCDLTIVLYSPPIF